MIQWVEEANRLRDELPAEIQSVLLKHEAVLLKHEAAGTFNDPEYQTAMMEFYNRHVCRVVPNPEYVQRSFAKLGQNPEVYNTMNGPSEFHVIGTIKNWDVRHRLGEIHAPTLVTSGKYDEATPLIATTIQNGISGASWVLFEQSSHMAHVEETDRYIQVLTVIFKYSPNFWNHMIVKWIDPSRRSLI